MPTKYPSIKELLEEQQETLTSIQGKDPLETAIILIDVLCKKVLELEEVICDLKEENHLIDKELENFGHTIDSIDTKIWNLDSKIAYLKSR